MDRQDGTVSATTNETHLEALSKGLKPGWIACLDQESGEVYYGNLETKVRWKPRPGGGLPRCLLEQLSWMHIGTPIVMPV